MTACHLRPLLLALCACMFLLHSKANPQNKAVSLRDALKQVTKAYGTQFVYDPAVVNGKTTTYNFKSNAKKPVEDVLKGILYPNELVFLYISNNYYSIVSKDRLTETTQSGNSSANPAMVSNSAAAVATKQVAVSGTVMDNNGAPLPRVTVNEKGTNNTTITGEDGSFKINVAGSQSVLVFSSVGFATKEVAVGDQSTFTVILSQTDASLGEVVVVGYGTQKKINLTGAITQLNTDKLQDVPVTNLTQALQGQIPNLNIVIGSGKPGTMGSLNIRGNTSITSSGEPLILIDGVPSDDLDRVNINDVASVTVLKDASASAIYGARAAFGVILITTKTAKKGAPVISYNNNFGWTTHATNTDFITSAYDNIRINEEAYYNALGRKYTGFTDEDYDEIYKRRNDKVEDPARPWVMIKPNRNGEDVYKYYGNTDWYNWFYAKWRPRQQNHLSISGSSGKVNYYLSGDFTNEKGIMKHNPDDFKRYTFMAKVEAELASWFTISSTNRFYESDYLYHGKEGGMFPTVYNNLSTNQIYMMSPANVPTNPDGSGTYLTDNGTYAIGYGAHLAQMNKNLVGRDGMKDFTTTIEGKIKVSKDLTITGNYTFNFDEGLDMYRGVRLSYSLYPGVIEQVPRAEWDQDVLKETTNSNRYNIINLFGNYNKSFGSHNIEATVGYNREERTFKTIYSEGHELLSETLNDLNLATGEKQVHGGASEWALSGTFYRVNYDYDGKYLFETSGRYDGTSRFRKGDRFGFFPSFSLGWRISDEAFFSPLKNVINNLKIRGSYGSLGNQQVSTYSYISTMPTSILNYLVDDKRITAVSAPNPVSPDLTWERTISRNIGLDLDLLRNRLSVSIDGYIRDTRGMLIKGKTLPKVFGAPEPKQNAGDLRTRGFEFTINWRDQFTVMNKPLRYHVGLNLSDYTGRITKFDNPSRILSDYYVGERLGEIWGFTYDGYFKTDDDAAKYGVNQDLLNPRRVQAPTADLRRLQAGDIKIIDLDGNNKIDFGAGTVDNPGDRKIIGNSQPRYSFGIPLGASWNGIDLNILLQGIVHQNYYPDLENEMFWGPYARPYATFIPTNFEQKIWRPENPNSYFPRMIGYIAQNSELRYENDMYLQDIGYMKLRNLTLGYTISPKIIEKIKLKSFRVFVSGANLWTWTKLDNDYIDPEEVMWDKTGRTYPMGKTYSFGIDVRF